MTERTPDEIRAAVREQYGQVARGGGGCGCGTGCCGANPTASLGLGYSDEELGAIPAAANLGLGCGNPQAIASLCPGETVLDLGAGGGLDCFLAGRAVGPEGRVIGVDMTPDMVSRARASAAQGGVENVEFRLGEIEHLPVADGSVDVVLSNCVINLSPDQRAVFAEVLRVLKPRGRLAITDVVQTAPLPPELRADQAALTGCIAGAAPVEALRAWLGQLGFEAVSVEVDEASREQIREWLPGSGAERYVASARITARKPGGCGCGPGCCGG